MNLLADATLRSSVMLAAGLAATVVLRHRSAALRHFVLAAAVFGAAAIVPLSLLVPSWDPRFSIAVPAPSRASAVQPDTVHASAIVDPNVSDPTTSATQLSTESIVIVVWTGGVLVAAAVLLASVGRVRRIIARAEQVQDDRWLQIVDEVRAAYGVRRHVAILQTDRPDLLATWGLLRPRVLLPTHARAWSDDRVRVVVRHELAHIRRHDWAVQMGAEALRTFCWFNPLMWLACTRLRNEGEHACDDVVLETGLASRTYAGHLLDLAKLCRPSESACGPATPMARPSTLERRIAAMLNPRLDRRTLSRRAAALTAALVLVITLPAAAFRAGQNALRPVTGSIYDPTGAVLPGVEVTLEDAGQIKWQAVTDGSGRFEFPPVQNGRYTLEASLAGFRPLKHQFDMRTARDGDRAITLQVGDLSESITVQAQRTAPPAPSAAQSPRPVRIGGNIRVPRKLHDVHPVYPVSMREAGREGIVPVEAVIGRDGIVQSLRVLSANIHPDFAVAAVDAVRQWRFDPTLLNGLPVEVVMTVTITFSLE